MLVLLLNGVFSIVNIMIYSSVVILARAVIITDCKAIVKMIMAVDPYKHTGDFRVLRILHRFTEPQSKS